MFSHRFFFLHLCLLSTIPIFFSIYLKFSYLLSMFIRRSIIYMWMRSCIDIENLCFFCSPFFSSNIFYLFIFPSERTRIVESFIQFFFSPIRFRHHFCAVIVAVILLSISFALCRAIYLRDLIRIQSQSPNGHHSIRFYRNTFLLKKPKTILVSRTLARMWVYWRYAQCVFVCTTSFVFPNRI